MDSRYSDRSRPVYREETSTRRQSRGNRSSSRDRFASGRPKKRDRSDSRSPSYSYSSDRPRHGRDSGYDKRRISRVRKSVSPDHDRDARLSPRKGVPEVSLDFASSLFQDLLKATGATSQQAVECSPDQQLGRRGDDSVSRFKETDEQRGYKRGRDVDRQDTSSRHKRSRIDQDSTGNRKRRRPERHSRARSSSSDYRRGNRSRSRSGLSSISSNSSIASSRSSSAGELILRDLEKEFSRRQENSSSLERPGAAAQLTGRRTRSSSPYSVISKEEEGSAHMTKEQFSEEMYRRLRSELDSNRDPTEREERIARHIYEMAQLSPTLFREFMANNAENLSTLAIGCDIGEEKAKEDSSKKYPLDMVSEVIPPQIQQDSVGIKPLFPSAFATFEEKEKQYELWRAATFKNVPAPGIKRMVGQENRSQPGGIQSVPQPLQESSVQMECNKKLTAVYQHSNAPSLQHQSTKSASGTLSSYTSNQSPYSAKHISKVGKQTTYDKADKKATDTKADKKDTDFKADKKATDTKADKKDTDFKADKKATDTKADKKATDTKADKKATDTKADKKATDTKVVKKATDIGVDKKAPDIDNTAKQLLEKIRKIAAIQKELDATRKVEQDWLCAKAKVKTDLSHDPVIIENRCFQLKLISQMKAVRLGKEVAIPAPSTQEQKKRSMQEDTKEGVGQCCIMCQVGFSRLRNFLEHVHSENHQEVVNSDINGPWQKEALKKYPKEAALKTARGEQFLVGVPAFFCYLCGELCSDVIVAEAHLHSREHHEKYNDYLFDHPKYERHYMLARTILLTSSQKGEAEGDRGRKKSQQPDDRDPTKGRHTRKDQDRSPERESEKRRGGKDQDRSPERESEKRRGGKDQDRSPERESEKRRGGKDQDRSPERESEKRRGGKDQGRSPERESEKRRGGKDQDRSPEKESEKRRGNESRRSSRYEGRSSRDDRRHRSRENRKSMERSSMTKNRSSKEREQKPGDKSKANDRSEKRERNSADRGRKSTNQDTKSKGDETDRKTIEPETHSKDGSKYTVGPDSKDSKVNSKEKKVEQPQASKEQEKEGQASCKEVVKELFPPDEEFLDWSTMISRQMTQMFGNIENKQDSAEMRKDSGVILGGKSVGKDVNTSSEPQPDGKMRLKENMDANIETQVDTRLSVKGKNEAEKMDSLDESAESKTSSLPPSQLLESTSLRIIHPPMTVTGLDAENAKPAAGSAAGEAPGMDAEKPAVKDDGECTAPNEVMTEGLLSPQGSPDYPMFEDVDENSRSPLYDNDPDVAEVIAAPECHTEEIEPACHNSLEPAEEATPCAAESSRETAEIVEDAIEMTTEIRKDASEMETEIAEEVNEKETEIGEDFKEKEKSSGRGLEPVCTELSGSDGKASELYESAVKIKCPEEEGTMDVEDLAETKDMTEKKGVEGAIDVEDLVEETNVSDKKGMEGAMDVEDLDETTNTSEKGMEGASDVEDLDEITNTSEKRDVEGASDVEDLDETTNTSEKKRVEDLAEETNMSEKKGMEGVVDVDDLAQAVTMSEKKGVEGASDVDDLAQAVTMSEKEGVEGASDVEDLAEKNNLSEKKGMEGASDVEDLDEKNNLSEKKGMEGASDVEDLDETTNMSEKKDVEGAMDVEDLAETTNMSEKRDVDGANDVEDLAETTNMSEKRDVEGAMDVEDLAEETNVSEKKSMEGAMDEENLAEETNVSEKKGVQDAMDVEDLAQAASVSEKDGGNVCSTSQDDNEDILVITMDEDAEPVTDVHKQTEEVCEGRTEAIVEPERSLDLDKVLADTDTALAGKAEFEADVNEGEVVPHPQSPIQSDPCAGNSSPCDTTSPPSPSPLTKQSPTTQRGQGRRRGQTPKCKPSPDEKLATKQQVMLAGIMVSPDKAQTKRQTRSHTDQQQPPPCEDTSTERAELDFVLKHEIKSFALQSVDDGSVAVDMEPENEERGEESCVADTESATCIEVPKAARDKANSTPSSHGRRITRQSKAGTTPDAEEAPTSSLLTPSTRGRRGRGRGRGSGRRSGSTVRSQRDDGSTKAEPEAAGDDDDDKAFVVTASSSQGDEDDERGAREAAANV